MLLRFECILFPFSCNLPPPFAARSLPPCWLTLDSSPGAAAVAVAKAAAAAAAAGHAAAGAGWTTRRQAGTDMLPPQPW